MCRDACFAMRSKTILSLWCVACAILCLRAWSYFPYIADDAFISMRYAAHLLAGHGLVWNEGERVEGYSNLLWVLLTALLGSLGIDLLFAVRAMGVVCTLLTPTAFFWYARRNQLPFFAAASGVLAFAIMPSVAIWSIGGMEGPLLMLLMAWAAVLIQSLFAAPAITRALAAGICLGLICLLRPEGPIYTMALILPLLCYAAGSLRHRIALAAIISVTSAMFFFAQMLFRWFYYGEIFPNTVLAKVAFTGPRLEVGIAYVILTSFSFMLPLVYITLGATQAIKSGERTAGWATLAMLPVLAALIAVGGDTFPQGRAFLPLIPLIVLAFMDSAAFSLRHGAAAKEKLFIFFVLLAHVGLITSSEIKREPQDVWVRYAMELGKQLKKTYSDEKPLIAVYAAGAVPYYSELPAIDVLGLNDRYLTHHRSRSQEFGHGLTGHELFDGEYIDSRKPELLVFDILNMYSGCGMQRTAAGCESLLSHYHEQKWQVLDRQIGVWVRNDSKLPPP